LSRPLTRLRVGVGASVGVGAVAGVDLSVGVGVESGNRVWVLVRR